MAAPHADDDAVRLLAQAAERARTLLEDLHRQRADLQRHAASSPDTPLVGGCEAIDRAVASVERLLKDLEAHP